MAAASNVHSAEELNFLRLTALLIRIGPQAVRHVFDQEFPPSNLSTELAANVNKIKYLKDTKRVITAAQWNLLYPTAPHTVNSKVFDITLMVCLLRNLASFKLYDQDPMAYVYDTSKQANISRIKFYRNQIMHSKDGEMGQQTFTDIWNCVSGAILSLAAHLKQKVDELAHSPIDADALMLLKQYELVQEQNRKQLLDYENKLDVLSTETEENKNKVKVLSTEKENADRARQNTIRKWKKDNTFYKATTATAFILDTLAKSRGVIVTGPPGCGKSAAAHHVALIFENQDYELYPINHPKDIMKVFCKEKQQVFIIDDICGKFTFDLPLSNAWEEEEKCLRNLLMEDEITGHNSTMPLILDLTFGENQTLDTEHQEIDECSTTKSKFKVIATCREYIFTNNAFPDFQYFDFKQCSLTKQYKLSDDELKTIARSYLDETTLKCIDNINLFDFFPLLCSWFNQRKDIRLFTHPVDWIDSEIKGLKKHSHPSFIALALLVLYNNDLKKEDLKNKDMDNLIEDICKECHIEQALSKKPDQVTFNKLVDIFITETEDGYTAVHDKMFDIISISISTFIMKVIIQSAPIDFIKSRMQFKNLGECEISNVIYIPGHKKVPEGHEKGHEKMPEGHEKVPEEQEKVPKGHEKVYMDRMNREIKNGNYWPVFDNLNTKKEEYRKTLSRYLDVNFASTKESFPVNSKKITPLHVVACLGYLDLVKYFACKHDYQLQQTDFNGQTPYLKACEKGKDDVVRYLHRLVDKYPTMLSRTTDGSSALHFAASTGEDKVVQLLVDFGMNMNETNNNNLTPLVLACAFGHLNTVKLLLDLNGGIKDSRVDTMIKDKDGLTALHRASLNGHTEIISLLVKYGMNVNDGTNYNHTPLYFACANGHSNTVELLLSLNGDVKDSRLDTRIKDKYGVTVLHAACYNGHTEILTLLVNYGLNVDDVNNSNETALHLACWNGHYNTAKLLLDSRVDTRIKQKNGLTALHAACFNGHTKIVTLLVNYGLNVDDVNNRKQTPLYLACFKGHYNTVELLVGLNGDVKDSRVDTRIKDKDGSTALHAACYKGHKEIVTLLVNYGMDVNDVKNDNYTPLYVACRQGHYNTAKLLIDLNGDVKDSRVDTRIKDQNGLTALHAACYKGHKEIVTLLVNYGMDVNDVTNDNYTPLYVACRKGHYNTVKLLLDLNGKVKDSRVDTRIKAMDGATALHAACYNGHTEIVTMLVNYGMNINDVDNYNMTPLYLACGEGQCNTARLLLDFKDIGVDSSIKDKNGLTALHAACYKGHIEIVTMLVNYGINVNDQTNDYHTPLSLACLKGHYTTARLLLDLNGGIKDSRVDTRIKNKNGETALHAACFKGHVETVTLLVNYGMNVNDVDNNNSTPLYLACYNGHYDTVKLLLNFNRDIKDSRVDTRMKDKNGGTALHAACLNGHTDTVKLLVNYGMNVNDTNYEKETPLFCVCCNGHYNTARLLLDFNKDVKDSRVDTRIKDKNRWTALHAACNNGHAETVTLLVNYGMNVNDVDKDNQAPLFLACYKGHYNTVKLLLDLNGGVTDSRVDTRIKDIVGLTALHAACFNGHKETVTLLVDYGMNINDVDDYNRTPLLFASRYGHYDTVKLLLDLNEDVKDGRVDTRIKAKDGSTALHIACFNGHTATVELLVNYGMNVNEVDNEFRTPLFLACYGGHFNTVKLLLDLNLDVKDSRVDTSIKGKGGWTALHVARLYGRTEIIKLLVNHGEVS